MCTALEVEIDVRKVQVVRTGIGISIEGYPYVEGNFINLIKFIPKIDLEKIVSFGWKEIVVVGYIVYVNCSSCSYIIFLYAYQRIKIIERNHRYLIPKRSGWCFKAVEVNVWALIDLWHNLGRD